MPNTKSAKRHVVNSEKRRVRNFAYKSKIKTAMAKLTSAIDEGNKEQAEQLLPQMYSLLDKASKKKIIKSRSAARRKAQMSTKVNAIGA
jgi:small subunit ribosomal protein S20